MGSMEDKKKPLEKSGNIAVWPAKELKNGNKVYNVSFENADKQRNYVSIFANIAGHELKSDEALTLALGKEVRITDETQYGPRTCTIINRGIETKIATKDDKSYENNNMILGVAFHKLGQDGRTFGYLCNGVSFFAESRDLQNDKSIYLTPKDCFKLLDGVTITKDKTQAFLKYVEEVKAPATNGLTGEEKTYKTARLEITKVICDYNFHIRDNTGSKEKQETAMTL